MFRRGILLSPRRRYQVPYGNTLYMPLREMSIGTSSNLLDNGNFDEGVIGWSTYHANIVSESEIVRSGYSLKVTANGNYPECFQLISTNKYNGISAIFKGWGYGLSDNTYKPVRLLISDYNGIDNHSDSVGIISDDVWHYGEITKKIRPDATYIRAIVAPSTASVADYDDVAYFDDLEFTVPQMVTPNGVICHPEGCIWTPEGFLFDGVDDLITFESDFIGASACTIMGWIKPTGWGGFASGRIIDNDKLFFSIGNDTLRRLNFSSNIGTATAVSPNDSITLNQWQHVAVTRKTDGKVTFYVNGQLSGTPDQNSGTPTAGTTNVIVGNRLAGDRGFDGTIDDLLVFNRILTPQEIQAHYSMTKWSY